MAFNRIIEKYRKYSFSERDKGDKFERLMQGYLLTDPRYANLFKKVWLWDEFPGRDDLGSIDTGIDLVALTVDGDYWAIQCKCYQESTTIDKPAVDSFLSTSSREFKDENLKTTSFTQRLWISTTNKWGSNATEAIKNQSPPVIRLNLYDLQNAPINWEKLDKGVHGEESRTPKKNLRPHQEEALRKTHKHFKNNDRGKLIMACGTGKTFNTLRIAEHETNGKGLILFLVPSISLLGQALSEWCAEAKEPINAVCICSDPEVSKKKTKNKDDDNFSVVDLALPASTNTQDILNQFRYFKSNHHSGMTVVFSTYQSIGVIARAQKALIQDGFGKFDLIICDEAHRTTGVTLSGDDESAFTKVHDNNFIQSKKRLYMTATPRLYGDDAKGKAAKAEAILCSMDDVSLYGEEIYRIGFGEAVERDLLTDYKVLILTLNENNVPPAIQKMIADNENEINSDDASKLIGCINALSKQILGDENIIKDTDPAPMKRAVAFCPKIIESKKIKDTFNEATDAYINSLPSKKRKEIVSVEAKHIDGTMSAPARDELLGWLKGDPEENECRVLTNVRCLSEGVDIPSLDAIMFLSAKNSQIDVVQSVGRVMRKAPGKKYGYIIIPVVVPADVEADKALDDNERYKVVWTVLNALRAHDDRFNATVNKIDLNRKKPDNILVGQPEYSWQEDGEPITSDPKNASETSRELSQQLAIQFEELQNLVFARMVQKVGERTYWEQWAKNVAEIAERHTLRISRLVKNEAKYKKAFGEFVDGLQKNINPSITEKEAIDMLSQHLITMPVFEALFEDYSFAKHNPISVAMQGMLELLEEQAIEKDTETLNQFYESIRKRAAGIDNSEGKQRIILELYEKYFKHALPKMVEKLGIVYTPVEVVDFIIHSVNDVLKEEFGRSISDENVNILDPFTGTGTFITRLLQSGLISKKDLYRKYKKELYANEIVLLAYYIAAVNIENAYHDLMNEKNKYQSFDGICLTDTFQLGETDENEEMFSEMFPQNSKRVQKQKNASIRVIMGNPPYSIGQKSANDNAQNQSYLKLDAKISDTYAKESTAGLNKSLYDPYIKAFRWSTDRLDPKNGGIIAFVSNGAWLDGNSTDGFRKCLEREFSSIYVFNLRGNARTQGEFRRKEAGNVFNAGSRTPIAITLLVKNPDKKTDKAVIHYHDIGDYLSRKEKLDIVKKFASTSNTEMDWETLKPNQHGDWLKQRSDLFGTLIPAASVKKFNLETKSFFAIQGPGILSSRDAWVYNFSKLKTEVNIHRMLSFYDKQRLVFKKLKINNPKTKNENLIDVDPKMISWTRALKKDLGDNVEHIYATKSLIQGAYRPYCIQNLYYDKSLIESPGLNQKFFPTKDTVNRIISVPGIGSTKDFTVLITDKVTDYQIQFNNQCFPLHYYEKQEKQKLSLFDKDDGNEYVRRDGVSDFILKRAKKIYGKNINKEDVFYYVYGILHNPNYRTAFANDLKKMLPHIPLVDEPKDFWGFSKAGRELADLHINYETVKPYPKVTVSGEESKSFKVEKMRFPKKDQKDTIIYNGKIVVSNIPAEAYEYVVNGKSAIEWVMDRYQVTTHKESGIKNDPNDWAEEVNNPRYILDLLLSIINVSMQTVKIVKKLPKLKLK